MRNIKKVYVLLGLFLHLVLFAGAQEPSSFEHRLTEIEQKLNTLAETEVHGLKEIANFSVVNAPVQELLRGIAETHRLNVSVDPAVRAQITNNFTNVKVNNLLLYLCREYRLDIRFINTILSFHPFQEAVIPVAYVPKKLDISYNDESDKISLDLKQDSLSVFARQLTRTTQKNVIIAPNVSERLLNGFISNMPFEQALSKIAYSNNLNLEKTDDGFYILNAMPQEQGVAGTGGAGRQRNQGRGQEGGTFQSNSTPGMRITPVVRLNDTLISVDAVNVPIKDVIQEASLALAKDYVFFSEPQGNTISNVQNITYDELLGYLLHGTTHTYKKQENVYLIGDKLKEGFRSTRLVRFQFRTLQSIDSLIPAEMARGVQITPFKELNGIILSGSESRIREIEAFLKAVDQPVPNIMIEVIVMDVRKGTSLKTGISAALGDTATQGSVFPGVDMTLSSRSINGVLDKLESAGVVNLGRVRPNFYATIQALEENQDIKVRSTPKLSTLNGHEAELSIGEKVWYLEEISNVSGGVSPIVSVSQNFKSIEANLNIKIIPMVSGDDNITLQIFAEFANFKEASAENPKAPPGTTSRKFVSQIRVGNEEMIVLGGLEEASKRQQGSGFPVLSRIPVLKWIFSARERSVRNDQLLVFIRPTIVY